MQTSTLRCTNCTHTPPLKYIVYTNADSQQTNIIAITKILPKNCRYPLQEKEIAIPGYQLFSNINQQGISIRGTVIYTHSSLKATDYVLTSEFADSIWVKIHLNNNDNLIIGCVYRSPNSTPENNDNFLALLSRVAETDPSHLLILGDVNLPDINWNTMTTNHSNLLQVSNRFIDLINDNYRYQHINFPTRYRLSQIPTQDDIVLTNEPDMVTKISQEAALGKSDHLYLSFSFNCYKSPSQQSFKKYYYD